jgi:hypothetical protein
MSNAEPLSFWLQQDVLAYVSWAALFVTVVGGIAGVVGLFLTYQQARNAKIAALDAKEAAMLAVQKLQSKLNLAGVASAIMQIESIKELVDQAEFRAARISFHAIRRPISDLLRISIDAQAEKLNLEKAMRTVNKQLDGSFSGKCNPALTVRALSGVSHFLLKVETDLKFADEH